MSYQRERDHFMARCQLSPETARALLRHATTLHRLAEAQCNGDWPADNGERKVEPCPLCEGLWVPSQIQGGTAARMAHGFKEHSLIQTPAQRRARSEARACPDCRTEARIHALLDGTQWQAWTQGDPRGYVLKLFPLTRCTGCTSTPRIEGTGRVMHHDVLCQGQHVPVTRDDMDCGRVDGLGVPTR